MNVFWFEVGDECQFLHLSHENCNVQHGKLLLKKVASTCTKTAILFELLMFVQFHQLFCCFDCSIILLQNKSHQSNPPVPPLLFLGFSNSSFESAKKQCQEHRIRISKLENGKRILRIFGICEKKEKKNIGFYFPALPRFTFLMKSNYKLMLFKRRGSQPSAICIFKYGIHHTGNSFGFFFAVPS